MIGTGTGTIGTATRRRRHAGRAALALWLVVLMLLAPVLSAAHGAPDAGQIVPALFVVPLLALGVASAAHVGRSVLAHRAPGVEM